MRAEMTARINYHYLGPTFAVTTGTNAVSRQASAEDQSILSAIANAESFSSVAALVIATAILKDDNLTMMPSSYFIATI